MQVFLVLLFAAVANAFAPLPSTKIGAMRVAPLNENFFLDIAEDPAANTPAQIFGEVAYKSFVEKYDPEALLIGGPKYNIIERIRELKLLKLTAESGLLEALEEKGVTLSKLEALLPVADNLGVLPLVAKNKDFLLSNAWLLIEPAPLLIPVLVNVLKTSPSTFLSSGLLLLGTGAFEFSDGQALIGLPALLLGLPLTGLGAILSGSVSVPLPSGPSASSSPVAVADREAPTKVSFSAPKAAKRVTSNKKSGVATPSSKNGQRKTIRIR